jgi:hypothetical protein
VMHWTAQRHVAVTETFCGSDSRSHNDVFLRAK